MRCIILIYFSIFALTNASIFIPGIRREHSVLSAFDGRDGLGTFFDPATVCAQHSRATRKELSGQKAFVIPLAPEDDEQLQDAFRLVEELLSHVPPSFGADIILMTQRGSPLPSRTEITSGRVKAMEVDLMVHPHEMPELIRSVALPPDGGSNSTARLLLLNIIALDRYTSVIALKPSVTIRRPGIEVLFSCPQSFLYTASPEHVFEGGMAVFKPDRRAAMSLAHILRRHHTYTKQTGWVGVGFPCLLLNTTFATHTLPAPRSLQHVCPPESRTLRTAVTGLEGLVWSYFIHHSSKMTGKLDGDVIAALNPCVYGYFNGFHCTAATYGASIVVLKATRFQTCGMIRDGCRFPKLVTMTRTGPGRRVDVPACRPSYFIVGVRKGGTTDLYVRLTKHPRVKPNSAWYLDDPDPMWQAQTGETFAFMTQLAPDAKFEDEINRVNRFFPELTGDEMTGDSTVSALSNALVPKRMAAICPTSSAAFKVIVLVREPIARLMSMFQMRLRLMTFHRVLNTSTTAEEYVGAHLHHIKKSIGFARGRARNPDRWWQEIETLYNGGASNLLYDGLYILHIHRWLRYFPREQIRIVCSEDLWDKPHARPLYRELQQFIGLEPHPDVVTGLGGGEELEGTGTGAGNATDSIETAAAVTQGPGGRRLLGRRKARIRMARQNSTDVGVANSAASSGFSYQPHHTLTEGSPVQRELAAFYRYWNRVLHEELGVTCPWMADVAQGSVWASYSVPPPGTTLESLRVENAEINGYNLKKKRRRKEVEKDEEGEGEEEGGEEEEAEAEAGAEAEGGGKSEVEVKRNRRERRIKWGNSRGQANDLDPTTTHAQAQAGEDEDRKDDQESDGGWGTR